MVVIGAAMSSRIMEEADYEIEIAALHAANGELLRALQMMLALNSSEAAKTQARIAIVRAIPCGECHLPPGEECDICGKTQP